MEGNPLLNPVGSLPPQVYWRRRAMAAIVAVLVIWFGYSAFPGKGGGANAAQPPGKSPKTAGSPAAVTPSTTPAAPAVATSAAPATTKAPKSSSVTVTSPPATTTSAAPTTPSMAKCSSSTLSLSLTSDHTVYAAGADPTFVVTVANTGKTACRVDVGTTSRNFLVTSGSDRIWSSADCTKASPNVQTFAAKQSVGYSHTWTRQRSSAAGCAAAGTAARAGTYHVVAHVGGLTSAPVVFQLR